VLLTISVGFVVTMMMIFGIAGTALVVDATRRLLNESRPHRQAKPAKAQLFRPAEICRLISLP
jgi:hypothetical protein